MIDSLAKCPLFEGVERHELLSAAASLDARMQDFGEGAYLLREGDRAGEIGVLLGGAAAVVREDEDGTRSVQAQLAGGDLFAETFAAAGVAHMPVSVVGTKRGSALFFNYTDLLRGGESQFREILAGNLLAVLARKNLMLNARLNQLSQRSTRQKLLHYLAYQAEQQGTRSFNIPFDRQALADYLCVERTALSAEMSRMKADGLITYRKSHFTLL